MHGNPLLILASNSPRRRELLALGEWVFEVRPGNVGEELLPGEEAAHFVLRLAESKARACAAPKRPTVVILGADTTVALDGRILGKPADPPQAVKMLRDLRARVHQVLTGLAVFAPETGRLVTDLRRDEVGMRAYTDDEIQTYVGSGDPLDKAGAYAIQHAAFHPVQSLEGCFASVMGLPLCNLIRCLRELGVASRADLPGACQEKLRYACPVSAAILAGVPGQDSERKIL